MGTLYTLGRQPGLENRDTLAFSQKLSVARWRPSPDGTGQKQIPHALFNMGSRLAPHKPGLNRGLPRSHCAMYRWQYS